MAAASDEGGAVGAAATQPKKTGAAAAATAKAVDPDAPMADQPLANQKPVKPPPKPTPAPAYDDDETADGQSKGLKKGKSVKPGGAKDAILPPLWAETTIKHSLVKYGDGNVNLTGFMAYSNATLEKRPVVIIVPDADGIGNYEKWRASMLAANGYVGFVADLYGNGVEQGPGLPIASRSALLKTYVTNEGLLKGRIINALNAIRNLPQIDQSRAAVIGWGFGGAAALQLFRCSSEADGVAAVAAFHPSPLNMGSATAPMQPAPGVKLALYMGGADKSNRAKDIDALRAELAAAKAAYTWTEYSSAAAGFGQADLPPRAEGSAIGYDPAADASSWYALRGLLLQAFDGASSKAPYTPAGGKTDVATGFMGATALGAGGAEAPSGAEPSR